MNHTPTDPDHETRDDTPRRLHPEAQEFLWGILLAIVLVVGALALDRFVPLSSGTAPPAADPSAEAAISADRVREILLANPDIIIIEAVSAYEMQQREADAARDATLVARNSAALFANPDDWSGGADTAPVSLVEFFDYACSFCKRAAPEIQHLLETRDDFRLVKKELPILGAGSADAAKYAIATRLVAGDAAYAAFHEALMAVDRPLVQETFERVASGLGLPAGEIAARMDDPEIGEIIDANRRLAAALGIKGTPGYVLKGAILRGYRDREGLARAIEDATDHVATAPGR